nr:hypothetical protein [Neisseria lactamica]
MKPRNLFFAGCLLTSAVFAEDVAVPVEPINVGSRAAMPSEGESLALLPFAEDVPPVRDAMPSEVPKSAAGGDVRDDRIGMQINRALLARDWAALKRLLAQYAEQPQLRCCTVMPSARYTVARCGRARRPIYTVSCCRKGPILFIPVLIWA